MAAIGKWMYSEVAKMDKLKPCPFCGGSALYLEERAFAGIGKIDVLFSVKCVVCGSRTRGSVVNDMAEADRKIIASMNWNRRAEDDKQRH